MQVLFFLMEAPPRFELGIKVLQDVYKRQREFTEYAKLKDFFVWFFQTMKNEVYAERHVRICN